MRTVPYNPEFPISPYFTVTPIETQAERVPLRRKCASVESLSWHDARGSSNFLISMQFPRRCEVLLNKNCVIELDGGNGS